ncbi:hypothetical protein F4824DRAFT_464218 [Ustulina deusta]|nr:hypothetical protein F4824DRAFT_464218 [Ustulina deusta]
MRSISTMMLDRIGRLALYRQYAGSLVPVGVSIISGDIFLFRGPNGVAEIWKPVLIARTTVDCHVGPNRTVSSLHYLVPARTGPRLMVVLVRIDID